MNAVKNAKKKADEKPQASGLEADNIGDLSDLLNESEAVPRAAHPLELPLDLIDEDPEQPRTADNPGFSPDSIAEIGQTIKIHGGLFLVPSHAEMPQREDDLPELRSPIPEMILSDDLVPHERQYANDRVPDDRAS